MHDLGAGLLRRPGEAREAVALRVVEVEDMVAGGHRRVAQAAQVGELQLFGDAAEQAAGDQLDRHQHRRVRRRADGGRRDHRRVTVDVADDGGLPARAVDGVADGDGAAEPGLAAAHIGQHRLQVRHHLVHPGRRDAVVGGAGVDRLAVGVENEHVVVVEEGLQPEPDLLVRPMEVETLADVADGGRGIGDALHLAQHAAALRAEHLGE